MCLLKWEELASFYVTSGSSYNASTKKIMAGSSLIIQSDRDVLNDNYAKYVMAQPGWRVSYLNTQNGEEAVTNNSKMEGKLDVNAVSPDASPQQRQDAKPKTKKRKRRGGNMARQRRAKKQRKEKKAQVIKEAAAAQQAVGGDFCKFCLLYVQGEKIDICDLCQQPFCIFCITGQLHYYCGKSNDVFHYFCTTKCLETFYKSDMLGCDASCHTLHQQRKKR